MCETMEAERTIRPVAPERFRDAMARFGAAVSVVTTATDTGQAGFTATAVCSVTDNPATLLVCVNRSASASAAFRGADTLCINVLAAHQTAVGMAFGGKVAMAERFSGSRWSRMVTGAPVLEDAAVSLDCRIVQRQMFGTHEIIFCEVLAVELGEDRSSLVYLDRRFHTLGGSAQASNGTP